MSSLLFQKVKKIYDENKKEEVQGYSFICKLIENHPEEGVLVFYRDGNEFECEIQNTKHKTTISTAALKQLETDGFKIHCIVRGEPKMSITTEGITTIKIYWSY